MSPFSFLQRGNLADHAKDLSLTTYLPLLRLENLMTGVDNVRHDVFLSPRFSEVTRAHLARLIAQYGDVKDLVAEEEVAARPPSIVGRPADSGKMRAKSGDPGEFKKALIELHIGSLNRAKSASHPGLDLLGRLAVIKFLRAEMNTQFAQTLERCRARLKGYEGPRLAAASKAVELRERFAAFQVGKRPVLRRVGQELFETQREIEKEILSRMRRSLFGEAGGGAYDLFLNRLLFTEDGRDDYLNAEHYVMLGNFDRDPDRFQKMLEIGTRFLKSLNLGGNGEEDERTLDAYFSAPENAQELVAGGIPDESTPRGKSQKALIGAWVEMLENEQVMDHVVASYEAVTLLAQYSPPINAQQLKNALVSRTERKRVEALLEEQGKISTDNLGSAVKRVGNCKGADRAKIAGRFLGDFMRYHRDLRRLEAVNSALDGINVIGNEKLRELSSINNTLYEFLLPEEQKPAEDKVVHHVVLKADIRDSSLLTRTLFERGLNPASYFSLNYYDPVNKLLPKYEAAKVFIEGDAVILALFEREGEPSFGAARTCVLAKEMIEIVRAYNDRSREAGLPVLDLGIGVSYQDSAPLYLMDGSTRIMISPALNESDRLSSCTKGARKFLGHSESLFNVFVFQTVDEADTGGVLEDFLTRYNVGGIQMSEACFRKLKREISLQVHEIKLPMLWEEEVVRLYSGMVPVGSGMFHRLLVREGRIAHIEPRDYSLKKWTERPYYEVCTNPAIYEYVESGLTAAIPTA
ncbi:MAG: hypothetical protein L0099_14045 [Acidobacteria bacterium]|nr:hypothetical protein [Acidobacteriota bacterium]